PSVAGFALFFGPPQLFALMAFGLAVVAWLGGESIVKTLLSVVFGLLIGTVGTDIVSGEARLTFGNSYLLEGIDFVAVVVGLFGLGEVLHTVGTRLGTGERARFAFSELIPQRGEWRPSIFST